MCLLVLAWRVHPRYRLIVAANRDEYHERPAAPLAEWPEPPRIIAGRDLRAGGTWLGVDRRQRFGIVTNFREVQRPRRSAPSRGGLVPAFLAQDAPPGEFLSALEVDAPGYSGFNLLIGDGTELWYASNRADRLARKLPPGIYGLSNQFLDTPWPKLERVRRRFTEWLRRTDVARPEELLEMLADREPAGEHETDQTVQTPGARLDPQLERALAAPFVVHPVFGTRCSTVMLFETSGDAVVVERRFAPEGHATGETEFRLNGA
ncbi:MAG: NRDE family protein [Pseudomonadota bacterium]|jgi:Uncharacterized conserved protein|nr:MAG: hypothetical protein DIU56_02215 [Pseudomonadota bacterium]